MAGCEGIYQDEDISTTAIARDRLAQALSVIGAGDTLVVRSAWKPWLPFDQRIAQNTISCAKFGRKLLFHRQSLVQWIADGADRANRVSDGEQLTPEQLTGMLNTR